MSEKNKILEIIESSYKYGRSVVNLVSMLKRKDKDYYYRSTNFMTTVVYNGTEYIFPNRSNNGFPIKQLWVFKAVKHDAINFMKLNPGWEKPIFLPTNYYNGNYSGTSEELTGTDINSAYWIIAHKMGVISENTYLKATFEEYKVVRLAALAVLGRTMAFHKFEKGIRQPKPVLINPEIANLHYVYKAIRYYCYQIMKNIADILGDDFECYKTDCIYYKDTPENRKIVHEYLDNEGFTYKQLVYGDDDENQELEETLIDDEN